MPNGKPALALKAFGCRRNGVINDGTDSAIAGQVLENAAGRVEDPAERVSTNAAATIRLRGTS
jgi:hypothetical protein